ncbi:hypothetical protein FHL15_000522 [Xylaria flabelliformis]|uniref:Heterokaryon incompatibility domain-containing protein n=1 Tax=Xylaria flabelliformis TaxID=2512241 RepID=A0A553IE15_9PEZI|nr:hypothetical protein FHL15_000522 [Xylaria flabelliformis]
MYLLNVHTRQLQEFIGDRIPPYAILSHTWGEDEVLFQDLSIPGHREKLGYKKIEGCCQQAILDGFEFVLVDTCCIDKRSSAELSEAINSMFRWYGEARVCYVYLIDVFCGEDLERSRWNFRNSRWFTRGWTLQELIAPSYLRFYDTTWSMMFRVDKKNPSYRGNSKIYNEMIEEMTGIRRWHNYAFGDPSNMERLADVPVATKLSWVSERRTTRVEDMAYCLLGLLDVNMPLLYGEGQKAFLRLQEEFLKKHYDPSIVCWGLGMDCLEILNVRSSFDTSCLASTPLLFRGFRDVALGGFQSALLSMRIGWTVTPLGLHIDLPIVKIDIQQNLYIGVTSLYAENDISRLMIPLRKVDDFEIYNRIPTCGPFFLGRARKNPGFDKIERRRKTIYFYLPPSYRFSPNGTWGVSLSSNTFRRRVIDITALHKAGFVLDSIYPPLDLLGFRFTSTHIILALHRGQSDMLYLRVTCLKSQLSKLKGRRAYIAALYSCPYESKRSAIEVWDAGRKPWARCFQTTLQLSWQETMTIKCENRVEHVSLDWIFGKFERSPDEGVCVLKVRVAHSDEVMPVPD